MYFPSFTFILYLRSRSPPPLSFLKFPFLCFLSKSPGLLFYIHDFPTLYALVFIFLLFFPIRPSKASPFPFPFPFPSSQFPLSPCHATTTHCAPLCCLLLPHPGSVSLVFLIRPSPRLQAAPGVVRPVCEGHEDHPGNSLVGLLLCVPSFSAS